MSSKLARKIKQHQQVYTPAEIIKANFPVYDSFKNIKHSKINNILAIYLGGLLLFSGGLYALVVSKQSSIDVIHSETKKLYAENVELQSKLDSLKSFDNIDAKLSRNNFLKRPEKVIEVNTQIPDLKVKFEQKGPNIDSMLGY